MDNWILARTGTLISKIREYMDQYIIYKVYPEIQAYIEDLANWYTKFNRIRMKGRGISREEQGMSLSTCWNTLFTLSQILAPFAPFISETFYQQLKVLLPIELQLESVHLCDYPKATDFPQNKDIERKIQRLQHVSNIVRALRSNSPKHSSSKVPVEAITIFVDDPQYIDDIKEMQLYLLEDINCFSVNYNVLKGMISYAI